MKSTHPAEDLGRRPETRIAMRIAPTHKALLERAASVRGLSLTDYITSVTLADAQRVLLEQTLYALDEDAFNRMVETMERPEKDNPRLSELFSEKRNKWKVTSNL